jgi:hypothetical protein
MAWLTVLADPDVAGDIAEMYEEPNLAGKTDVVLVDLDAMDGYARGIAEQVIAAQPHAWPDGERVTPWADPWHDIMGDIRRLHGEQGGYSGG